MKSHIMKDKNSMVILKKNCTPMCLGTFVLNIPISADLRVLWSSLLVFKSHGLQKQTPLHLTLFEKYPENLKTVTNTGQKKKSQVSIGRKENLSNLARKNLFSAPFPSLQMPPLDFIYALHVVFV